MCKMYVIGCGRLSGNYRRDYSSLTELMVKDCIFCSSLHKVFSEMAKADPEKLQHPDSQYYYWTIRTAAKSRESKNSIVIAFYPRLRKTEVETNTIPQPEISDTPTAFGCTVDLNDDSGSSNNNSNLKNDFLTLGNHFPPRKFHFLAEHELGQIPTRDDIGVTTNLASKAVGQQIKAWINECNERHEKCIKVSKTTWVPTRLLDVRFGDGSSIRLVDTKEEGAEGPYVTLSHCWGPNHKFSTTTYETETLYRTQGIKIPDLKSTNFEQAISVARHLGIRYIWIGKSKCTRATWNILLARAHFSQIRFVLSKDQMGTLKLRASSCTRFIGIHTAT
jgi:hypothetical protein